MALVSSMFSMEFSPIKHWTNEVVFYVGPERIELSVEIAAVSSTLPSLPRILKYQIV